MTLRARLIIAQIPVFLALLILCGISLVSLNDLGDQAQAILKDNYRSVLASQRMKEAVERLDDDLVEGLLSEGSAHSLRQKTSPHLTAFESELAVQESNITEPGEVEITGKIRSHWEETKKALDALFESASAYNYKNNYTNVLSPKLRLLRSGLDEILGINQDAMIRKSSSAKVLAEKLWVVSLSSAVAAAIVALALATMLVRRAVNPLNVLTQTVRRIGEGDLAIRAQLHGKDEIAQLAKDVNFMAESLDKYQKSSLGELLRAQQAAQAAIDSLFDPVVIFGVNGELLSMNRAAEELFRNVNNLSDLDASVRAVVARMSAHVFGGKGAYVPKNLDEAVGVPFPGGDRFFIAGANPLHDENGATIGLTAVFQDVTRFKRFDELKDDMVYTVSHEFKSPLTSIRMAIHLCLEEMVGPINPKQAELLSAAREDCERLQVLVDDLLDLSRLQRGISPTNPETVEASALVSGALARNRDAAQNHGVKLSYPADSEDGFVLADKERISIVMDNLISNALRYSTEAGAVELRTRRYEGRMRFEVKDTGPGIPLIHQKHLFEKFYQIPGVEGGSAGLGLSICREIILAHGGEIGVESEPGFGSTFWFFLNEAKPEA